MTEPVLPESISPDELAYHQKLIERVKFAETVRPQVAAIDAAWRSWAEHLHNRYGLGAGDNVDEHGQINRIVGDGHADRAEGEDAMGAKNGRQKDTVST
jgi:hypothetical protein